MVRRDNEREREKKQKKKQKKKKKEKNIEEERTGGRGCEARQGTRSGASPCRRLQSLNCPDLTGDDA